MSSSYNDIHSRDLPRTLDGSTLSGSHLLPSPPFVVPVCDGLESPFPMRHGLSPGTEAIACVDTPSAQGEHNAVASRYSRVGTFFKARIGYLPAFGGNCWLVVSSKAGNALA